MATDAFTRVAGALSETQNADATTAETAADLNDLLELTNRMKNLRGALGSRMVEASPYMKSALRMATESNIWAEAKLRPAVGF